MNHDQISLCDYYIKIMRSVSMLIMAPARLHYNVHHKGSLVQIKIFLIL